MAAVRQINTILIANRGEIARRVIRTARTMGIATVAVFSDADDGAPHMREADRSIRLAGSAAIDTYLRSDLILAAARMTGADAIHPGYGFLSENAAFARACADAGVIFIGPSPEAIAVMGSKVQAKQMMADAGVPVLAGFTVATATTETQLRAAADEISYPVMVKAAFGGGGRGMRIVADGDQLVESVAEATREALTAFGDGTVFLERYVEGPRHIEVQIFGDHHGTVVSLFERECSIQRRHQKVIEEAPSPAVSPAQRDALCEAARTAAKSLDYVGAGTVEFVMDESGAFHFLEVNTRLQVEHPVTEAITGLDLVRLQIEVARGLPLPPEVHDATINGHAIEARLYAEDVVAGFVPTSGPVDRLRVPSGDGIRVDSGYEDGSTVSTFYDAMLSKVIAWAPSRTEAANALASALSRAEIHGIVTNRDLLVNTLRDPEFLAGRTDTSFLTRREPATFGLSTVGPEVHQMHALAAALALDVAHSPQPAGIPRSWRNVGVSVSHVEFVHGGVTISVAVERSRAGIRVAIDGEAFVDITVIDARRDSVEFELLGERHRVALHRVGQRVDADSASGASTLVRVERFRPAHDHVAAGSLVSPMPGTVVAVHARVGDTVTRGQTLLALEAMKMEHPIRSPLDGVVSEVRVAVGAQVQTDEVLVVVTELSESTGEVE